MKITLAVLADFALAHDDGKLYITGGGLHHLTFGKLPGVYPRISLALEVEFAPAERASAQTLLIQGTDPTGQAFIKPELLSVALTPTLVALGASQVPIVYHMQYLTFPHEGEYLFTVSIGEEQMVSLPVRATILPGLPTELSAMLDLLQQGFSAFGARDLDGAERLFRSVIEAMPSFAMAHNNLGFVLLDKGQVAEALAEFQKAGETGFDRLELLEANMGCCHYLLGNPTASVALFDNCLNARSFSGGSILHGISDDQLFLVSLPSAGAYTQLMALNAAWSAFRAGQGDVARRRLEIAGSLGDVTTTASVTDSMNKLRSELASAAS